MIYRIPGVYVEGISTLPPPVAQVETAIPAFIGYTERARKVDDDLHNRPTRIHNFAEYQQYYGAPDAPVINVTLISEDTGFRATVTAPPTTYFLYYAVKMFFDNGGGECYITSVGSYTDTIELADFERGLDAVRLEDISTLLVCPEAVRLGGTGYNTLAQAMLSQCGNLKDRFSILDLFDGGVSQDAAALADNRARVGSNNLKFGALYYPYLRSNTNHYVLPDESNVNVTVDTNAPVTLASLRISSLATCNAAKAALLNHYVIVPPSGAIAGIYAAIDSTRGVWKAPANVSLNGVVEPVVRLNDVQQGAFNVDVSTGRSVNVIRAFPGKGTLVWGARTLAGNDNEWRYISVRRFFNMVEESVKKSTNWVVFEPNDANTWNKVRGVIENYLVQNWRAGALAGATAKEAFFVNCGLGVTMNAQDILEGRMIVEIGMAVVRPAEFIILKFSHKMQAS